MSDVTWTDEDKRALEAAEAGAKDASSAASEARRAVLELLAKRAASRGRTAEALLQEATDDLARSYHLVYVDRGDRLTEEQVALVVAGESAYDDNMSDWAGEQQWSQAREIIDDVVGEVLQRWENEDDDSYAWLRAEFDRDHEETLRERIYDRDESNPERDLARGTPDVLLRITCIDEDDAYSFEPVTAEQILRDLGFETSEANVKAVQYALDNSCTQIIMAQWIVGADVEDLLQLDAGPDDMVELVNPHLFIGNPFAGAGFITEGPLQGVARVRRGDLQTDKKAFGYSVDDVYGGLYVSEFKAEIRPVAKENAG